MWGHRCWNYLRTIVWNFLINLDFPRRGTCLENYWLPFALKCLLFYHFFELRLFNSAQGVCQTLPYSCRNHPPHHPPS